MPPYEPDVLLTSVEHGPPDGVFKRTSLSPARAALVGAVHTLYRLHYASAERPPAKTTDLAAMDGQKVTVLVHSTNDIFNAPKLLAFQGRVVTGSLAAPLGLILKGHRTHGIALTDADLIDAVPGWTDTATNQLRTRCAAARALLPDEVAPLTPDTITAVPKHIGSPDSRPCATVLLSSAQLPGQDRVHGCLWLISHRNPSPGDDILNGVLLTPPSQLTSDHGSILVSQLPRYTAVLPTAAALTYAAANDLADTIDDNDLGRSYLSALAQLTRHH